MDLGSLKSFLTEIKLPPQHTIKQPPKTPDRGQLREKAIQRPCTTQTPENSRKVAHKISSAQHMRPMVTASRLHRSRRQFENERPGTSETTKQIENKVKSELQMKNYHHILRSLRRETQEEPKEESKFAEQFSSLSRLLLGNQQPTNKQIPDRPDTASNIVIQNSSLKVLVSTQQSWLKKHGTTLPEAKFSSDLFDVLDKDKNGWIDGEYLLESLLSLGIASEPKILEKTLSLLLKVSTLHAYKVTKTDFKSILRTSARAEDILKRLNQFAKEERSKKAVSQKKTMSFSQALGIRLFKSKVPKKKNKLITINEHQDLLHKWWKSLEPTNNKVSVIKVAEKLTSLGMVPDIEESRRFLHSVFGLKQEIMFSEFEYIFAKSMLKGALSNLAVRLREIEPENMETAIASYSRSLLMSGVECPNSEISFEEGSNSIKALEKFYLLYKTPLEKSSFHELKEKMEALAGISKEESIRRTMKHTKHQNIKQEVTTIFKTETERPVKRKRYTHKVKINKIHEDNENDKQEKKLIGEEDKIPMESSTPHVTFYYSKIAPEPPVRLRRISRTVQPTKEKPAFSLGLILQKVKQQII